MIRFAAAIQTTVLMGLLLAWHRPASACIVLSPGLAEISRSVPVNGSVVLTFRCGEAESCTLESLPTYTVHDMTLGNVEVPGRLVRKERVQTAIDLKRWALWRPDAPFIAGHDYELREVGLRTLPAGRFRATETDPFDPRSIGPSLSVDSIVDHSGPKVCCPVVPGFEICGSTERCFRTERTQRVQMTIAPLRITQPIEQWAYRTTFRVGDQSTVIAELPIPSLFFYADQADQYCYSLDAIHVVTGEVVRIGEGCMQFSSGTFSTYPTSEQDTDAFLRVCASPPAGMEARWQQLKDTGAGQPDAGTPPATPADASIGADAPDADDHESGCGLGSRSSGRQAYAALLLLFLFARRRRGSLPSSAS